MELEPPSRSPQEPVSVFLEPPRRQRRGRSRGQVISVLATAFGFALLVAAGFWAFVVLPGRIPEPATASPPPEAQEEPSPEVAAEGRVETLPLPAEDPDTVPQEPPAAPQRTAPALKPEPKQKPTTPEPESPTAPAVDESFGRAMSDGLRALERGAPAEAKVAFLKAKDLNPSSPSVLDGLARAEAGLVLQGIADHLRRATALEKEEDWAAAATHYQRVLALDPALDDAVRGRERAIGRARLASRLDGYLGHPHRLSTQEVLREASIALEEAREIEPAGPKLEGQRARLAKLIADYSHPVQVELKSDGLTEIVVYRVGTLGTFTQRRLELRPGRYTVVGSREGYRDVRRTLAVEAGKEPPTLTVLCEEKI